MAQITIDRVSGAKASGTELLKYQQFNHIICVNICVKNICVKKCVKILTQMLTQIFLTHNYVNTKYMIELSIFQ